MAESTPERVVTGMMSRDEFSRWLGINVDAVAAGSCTVSMVVRDEMLNGFGIAHGGILYALADSALAFAANSHGRIAVALSNSMSYPASVSSGDRVRATCTELVRTRSTATYDVKILDQADRVVGLFRGMVYLKKETHSE